MEDREIYYKNAIQNQIYRLPKEFELYVNYLINEKGLSYSEASKELTTIEAYYNVLAMHHHLILFKVSIEYLTQNCAPIEKFINNTLTTKEQNRLAEFYKWLEDEHMINKSIIFYPKEHAQINKTSEGYTYKRPNPKKIKGPEDVKFFKDDEKKYAQTTVDHKYSLEKCFKGKYTNYTYMIHDNEADTYFLNEDGTPIEIKRYIDARNFVKNLYKK